ncbi:MAG: hypothetical protein AAF515_22465 [Pseudomonadota bacterium]
MSIATSPLRTSNKALVYRERRGFSAFKSAAVGGTLLALTLLLQACGGGGASAAAPAEDASSTPPPSAAEQGEILLAITDAEGDFSAYEVDVTSIKLIRANGDAVETAPLSTRIDFNQLTEVSEFFTLATVPAATYDRVEMTIDFTDANVVVQDAAGADVAATVVDSEGNPADVVTLELMLAERDNIRVAPGRPALFSLDFDLDASNSIDLETSPPVVTVEPFLLATPELETDREHRVRGLLDSVDSASGSFTIQIRPFRHRDGDFGELTIATDEATEYDINGEMLSGVAGLDALALLEANAPITAAGSIADDGLLAQRVVAGSSVPWADVEGLRGTVTARSDNSVTVSGAIVDRADGTAFRGEVTLLVAPTTGVSTLGQDVELGIDAISVGSRISAIGSIVDDSTLDASEGRVRIEQSRLSGTVVSTAPFAVELATLAKRKVDAFDFTGTGVSADQDADPSNYEVDVVSFNADLVEGDYVRIGGLVAPFGFAAPDFNARTIIDFETDSRAANLIVNWVQSGGSSEPFLSQSTSALEINLEGSRSALKLRGIPAAVTNPLEAVTLLAPEDDNGAYSVKVRGAQQLHVFRSFAELTAELDEQLAAGYVLAQFSAHGASQTDEQTFVAKRAGFIFADPALLAQEEQSDSEG